MYDDQNPRDAIGRALPDAEPPANFDLDRIISDGYRARRRNHALLGGATTAGVAALAGALALTFTFSPGTGPNDAADAADLPDQIGEPVPLEVADPAMAGYPYSPEFAFEDEALSEQINDAALTVFGPILEEAGVLSDMGERDELQIGPFQRPGNYGQVWLRGYQISAITGGEEDMGEAVFELEALAPGGWTSEPGPITDQVFPQHIFSEAAHYNDRAPELSGAWADNGEALLTADHGCAFEMVKVYPNGSALRGTWNNCGSGEYATSYDDLVDAIGEFPPINFDTSELTEVDEVLEVPTGWLGDDTSWRSNAEADATATGAALETALDQAYPGADVMEGSVGPMSPLGDYRGEVHKRQYVMTGTLPFETPSGAPAVNFEYTLPGGWLPGAHEAGVPGPYLVDCEEKLDFTCEESEVDGRTVVTQVYEYDGGVEHMITAFHPDGWAVNMYLGYPGESVLSVEELVDLALELPAPVYDADAQPQVPAE